MAAKPGDTIGLQFTVQGSTGALTNADSLPTATHVRNGVDDAVSTALTVVNVSTGLYKVTGILPSGYSAGDRYQVRINATVGGVAAARLFDYGILDARRIADISDSSGRVPVQYGTATGQINLTAGKITSGTFANDSLTAAALAADAAVEIGGKVLDELVASHTVTGSLADYLQTIQDRQVADDAALSDLTSAIGTPTGASIAADIQTRAATGDAMTLTTPTHTAIATDVQTGLTAQGVTTVRAAKLDNLDAAVSSRNSTTPPTVAAIRTEMDSNSTKLANLDAAVSSRLATNGYTAPNNAGIATALANLATLIGRTDPATALNAIQTVTDLISPMLQNDGAGHKQFTVLALAQAPAGEGGGGGGGFTSDDRTALTAIQEQTALLSTDMNNPPATKDNVQITADLSG